MGILRKTIKKLTPVEAIEPALSLLRLFKRPFYRYMARKTIESIRYKCNNVVNMEIGSGNKKGKHEWLMIDMNDNCDIFWDLNWPMPFDDSSVDMIYSSHVLEHFNKTKLDILLRDCYRTLKSGGIFSASVPNARIYIDGYISGEFDFNKYLQEPNAMANNPRLDILNHIAYMEGHHRCMFDEEALVSLLKNTGFINVALRGYDPSIDPENRRHESIYAVGYKA
jgi:predicted SAM-dependent methyltransferase